MKKIILSILSIFFIAGASMLRAENVGVPAECEDVMLQAFYWDSYKDVATGSATEKYGRTKWIDLLKDTAAINANFDLVWFPPSARSTGGVGYYHTQLSTQDGDWGTKTKLKELIAALHAGNTKVIADIVINHRGNSSSWVSFYPDNFGTGYGSFQLKQEHICSGDEAFTSSESPYKGSTTHGAADSGTNDGGCRDLDHTNEYVQNWAKAYVRWMLNEMKYDGFRYDMTRGYDGKYLSMYNQTAQPYFSVSEYWMDNTSDQIQHLQAAEYNTLIFDFPLKWKIKDAIGGSTAALGQLRNPSNSLRGQGYKRYAVTFIDNHDTFEREDNQGGEFIGYNINITSVANKNKILQANAYILMMPGVPCVFYPHWKMMSDDINQMIAIRKRAGIHSESEVQNESGSGNKYEATIVGHRGTVILRLGAGRSKEVPEGYEQALEGGSLKYYSIFIKMNGGEGIEEVTNGTTRGEKFIKDGKLFIRRGEQVFDILGNKIL